MTNAAERPKRSSPRKDSMGFIDPDAIDPEAYEDVAPVLDPASFKPTTTKNRSPIAIVKRFLQRSAQEAVQQQQAGVYASLIRSPNPPDPTNIPGAATAAAATTDEVTGYDELGIGDKGIGDDDYVMEKDVEKYDEFGIVKVNLNYDDDSDFADEKPPADMSYYRDTNDMRGRNLIRGGPERPDTSGMTEAGANTEIKKWRKARKKYTDGLLAAKAKLRKSLEETDNYDDDAIAYLGVTTPFLRPMSAVEAQPMCVDHNYPSKEVLLVRIAEEANLYNVEVANVRSCNKRVYYDGRGGAQFKVRARPTLDKGWTVKEYSRWTVPSIPPIGSTQPVGGEDEDQGNQGNEDASKEDTSDGEEEEDEERDGGDDIVGEEEEGTADGDDIFGEEGATDNTTKMKKRQRRSPIKSKWLVPLIKETIAERPNMSHKECAHLLRLYVREDFLTAMIVHNAKMQCRFELFGNPTMNAQYATAMLRESSIRGHKVKGIYKTAENVMAMLAKIVVQEESDRRQASEGISMTRDMKKEYLSEWMSVNNLMLQMGGLGIPMIGEPTPQFCGGVFLSMSYSNEVVPYLQNVFQADAAHTNFGKYTLFSCYGSTANANTSPIAFAILFGNEDKAGWEAFFEFAKEQHPCLDHSSKTFITDQAKGLVESVKKVLPAAGHFHCSYHRRKNIEKYCKGGKKAYSGSWLYDKLLNARTKEEVERIKMTCATSMSDKTLKYVNSLQDEEQFPGARCSQDPENVFMYGRTASSSVESMNQANKPARDRTAVDVMQSMKLILDLESRRFDQKKKMAHEWTDVLTPYGNKLRDEIFAAVDFHNYHIAVGEYDDRWTCRVSYSNRTERRAWFVKEPVMGSHFGGCTCGKANTEGAPCHHMVAVVKSGRVKTLTPINCMPKWWTTEMWRLQYPLNLHSLCDFSIESIKQSETPEMTMRYCPPYSAPNKAGRPHEGKRKKGILEERKPKRKKGTVKEATNDWNREQSRGKHG